MLAWHLNQEVALLTGMCQHSPTASAEVHLEQDVHYNLLRSAHSLFLYLVHSAQCKATADPHGVLTAAAACWVCLCLCL